MIFGGVLVGVIERYAGFPDFGGVKVWVEVGILCIRSEGDSWTAGRMWRNGLEYEYFILIPSQYTFPLSA